MGVAPTVYGGHEHTLRQTLIALASGQQLDEHAVVGRGVPQVVLGMGHDEPMPGLRGRDRAQAEQQPHAVSPTRDCHHGRHRPETRRHRRGQSGDERIVICNSSERS